MNKVSGSRWIERTRFSDSSYTLNRMDSFSVDMNKQVEDTFVDDDSCDTKHFVGGCSRGMECMESNLLNH